MTVEAIPQEAALRLQLACIGGNEPATSYFELRPLARDGRPAPSERAFLPVRELTGAIERVRELAPRLNVYVGAAPRVRQDGTAGAVAGTGRHLPRPPLRRPGAIAPPPGPPGRHGPSAGAGSFD